MRYRGGAGFVVDAAQILADDAPDDAPDDELDAAEQ